MNVSATLDRFHSQAKANGWLRLFSIFCRLALAAGFFPAGMVKILGERFASGLSANHPMGHYLTALHQTGYYYTFIGVVQIAAAIMLLIPQTVTLGAFLYFPVILNICILTYATLFDGSLFTAPLMTLANLYLLGWNYEKWKYILPFNRLPNDENARLVSYVQSQEIANERHGFSQRATNSLYARFRNFFKRLFKDKFPALFFAGVFAAIAVCAVGIPSLFRVKPRNTLAQCLSQFKNSSKTKAGETFCDCIHKNGEPLDKCMLEFFDAPEDVAQTP